MNKNLQRILVTFICGFCILFFLFRYSNDFVNEYLYRNSEAHHVFIHETIKKYATPINDNNPYVAAKPALSQQTKTIINNSNRKLEDKNNDVTDVKIDLESAKTEAKRILSLIHARYQLGDKGANFFLSANNMKKETWDIMKYKYLTKMLTKKQTFLMIFGGSSVTAGHDGMYNQSYPAIVDARMRPILKSIGIDLIVHNIAQGANNCIPYNLCYESMGGMNPDFVGWEQSYNCGHDESTFELTARLGGYSSNKAVIYYSASGAWSPSACPPSKDKVPYASLDWKPSDDNIKEWNPSAADLKIEKDKLHNFNIAHSSAARFSKPTSSPEYGAVSPHGFNVWEPNPLCVGKKDGKDIKNCNGIDSSGGCDEMKFMTHEAGIYGSDSGNGANWHPTRSFHMLRGEAITWLYTMALLEGLYEYEEDIKKKSADELLKDYTSNLKDLQPPLPKSANKCGKYYCEQRPICFTDYRPHYSPNMTLTELLVGTTEWTYEPEDPSDWSTHYGYLDAKPLYFATGNQKGDIHFKINILHNDFVWICGAKKESLVHADVYLDENVVLPKDVKNYKPSENRTKWTSRKAEGNECESLFGLPVGEHVVSLSSTNSLATHTTALSHVIMWE